MTDSAHDATAGHQHGVPAPGNDAAAGGEPTPGPAGAEGWVWGDTGAIPPDAALPALVLVAIRILGAFWGRVAQQTGISQAGLGVMRLLAAREGLKSSEVAARGTWSPGTITSVVDTLIRDGYVERRGDTRDRRVVRLYLTAKGRLKTQEFMSQAGVRWYGAFEYVDEADEPAVRRFLVNTIERFGALVREERGQ